MILRIATHVYKVTQTLFKVTELSLLAPSVRTMYNHCKNILLWLKLFGMDIISTKTII